MFGTYIYNMYGEIPVTIPDDDEMMASLCTYSIDADYILSKIASFYYDKPAVYQYPYGYSKNKK